MWIFNSIRIFPQTLKDASGQIIPRLNPLSGGTVLQVFGYDTSIVTISAIIVGDTDRAALKALGRTGLSYNLQYRDGGVGSYTTVGTYFVKSFTSQRTMATCQTIRADLATNSPVYNIDLELYE